MTQLAWPIYALLIATPFMIALGQLLFKMTSEKLVASNAAFYTVMFNPVFILALVIYGSATLLWLYVLKTAPLAYAYSFMALTFVIVPLLARVFLGETLDLRFFIGMGAIVFGLIVIHAP